MFIENNRRLKIVANSQCQPTPLTTPIPIPQHQCLHPPSLQTHPLHTHTTQNIAPNTPTPRTNIAPQPSTPRYIHEHLPLQIHLLSNQSHTGRRHQPGTIIASRGKEKKEEDNGNSGVTQEIVKVWSGVQVLAISFKQFENADGDKPAVGAVDSLDIGLSDNEDERVR